jgi:hypothetical protein
MASWTRFVLKEVPFLAMLSAKTSVRSERGWGVVVSVSSLSLRLDTETESPLGSLFRPMRPSFSTATKEVRTLDRGRGEADGEGSPGGAQFVVSCVEPKKREIALDSRLSSCAPMEVSAVVTYATYLYKRMSDC